MSSDHPADAAPAQDPLDPERARRNPENAVDALEDRVLGGPERRLDGGHPDDLSPPEQKVRQEAADAQDRADDAGTEPAFDVDLDPEDQGSSAAAPRNPD